jgi:dTDP-glucose 4,6-dehydratase
VDAVLNVAAESHVDRSIVHDTPFVRTNINGTHALLSAALAAPKPPRFVQVSTDEVYGELPWRDPGALGDVASPDGARPEPDGGLFTESTPLAPRSPYSATKASGDLLALAYHRTHALDVVVTRCSNNYGPYQFPEKLIPLMARNAMKGEPLPLYGDGLNVRDWIHVGDHCRGLDAALRKGRSGEVYNFGGDAERTNLQVVKAIIEQTGADPALVAFVEDRRGHDRRYAVDATKAKDELSWTPLVDFDVGLAETIAWYGENEVWLGRIESGAYRE